MARGRCAGCGLEDPSAKKVERHVASCPDYLALYRTSPEKALSPEDEMKRWSEVTSSDEYQEAKAAEKDERYAGYRANNERRVEQQASRWKSRQFRSGRTTSTPYHANGGIPEGGRLTPIREGSADDAARRVASKQHEIRVG